MNRLNCRLASCIARVFRVENVFVELSSQLAQEPQLSNTCWAHFHLPACANPIPGMVCN